MIVTTMSDFHHGSTVSIKNNDQSLMEGKLLQSRFPALQMAFWISQ